MKRKKKEIVFKIVIEKENIKTKNKNEKPFA